MRLLANERGIALVTALMMTLITLAVIMAALYFVTQQTQLSAASKRYRTALEAAHGGGPELFAKNIIPQVFAGYSTSKLEAMFGSVGLTMKGVSNACMNQKLKETTLNWSACSADNRKPDPRIAPDVKFTLQGLAGSTGFSVYAKIVDTQQGNSDTTGMDTLEAGAGVTGSSPGLSPRHIPAIYRVEVQGERTTDPLEKARLTFLYAY